MKKAVPDLIRRQRALDKTMKRYRDVPFEWGKSDCMTMFRSHMVAMGNRKIPKQPKYSTALGAKRALTEMGFETVEALLDSLLPRIPPASALPGDIILAPGSEGLACLTICVGQKAFGWHEDETGAVVMRHRQTVGAWRG